jgi:hypothetical protein
MGRSFAGLIAIVAWASLILQFWLIVSGNNIPTPGYQPTLTASIVNFFSYFTILSNILSALLTTSAALAPRSGPGRFFARPVVATSVTLFMIVTGSIYTLILRYQWNPVGLQYVADAGLHYVMPPLIVLYWLTVVPKGALRLADVPSLLVFPLAYGAYTLLRGPIAAWYPYPFISVIELGYGRVFVNIVGMVFLFAVLGMILVIVDRVLGRAGFRSAQMAER